MIVRYFARCFLRCPRCHHFDAATVVRCRFFASCRKHFALFAISAEIMSPHRVCNLCEGFFAGETFFPSSKERGCLRSPSSRCVLKSMEYFFASAHQPRPQGLLAFQYGGGRREDPGTQRTKTIADWSFPLCIHTCALVGLFLQNKGGYPLRAS